MKKILGISLVAMMAVTTARADIASKAYVTVDQSANKEYNVITKEATPGVQLEQLDAKFGTITGTVAEAINTAGSAIKSVKVNGSGLTADSDGAVNVTVAEGATNGTVAVNGTDVAVHGLGTAAYTASTAYDAAGTASDLVADLDATPSQTADASNGQLALSLTEVDGVVTTISGSITPNTYDAHGAAATAETNAATYTDGKIGTLGTRLVGNEQVAYPDVKTYVDEKVATAASDASTAIAGLDATVSQAAAAGNGQLALSVTEENGIITAVSGSIAANTYDAYGAATSAVQALDGSITTVTDGVVTSISQTDGVVTAGMAKIVNANVADNADISMAKIDFPALENSTAGAYVLTAVSDGQNGVVYHWESITRAD